jgi:hypothetical protein
MFLPVSTNLVPVPSAADSKNLFGCANLNSSIDLPSSGHPNPLSRARHTSSQSPRSSALNEQLTGSLFIKTAGASIHSGRYEIGATRSDVPMTTTRSACCESKSMSASSMFVRCPKKTMPGLIAPPHPAQTGTARRSTAGRSSSTPWTRPHATHAFSRHEPSTPRSASGGPPVSSVSTFCV